MRFLSFLVITVLAFSTSAYGEEAIGPKKLIVITDMSPDDRLALQVMATKFQPEDIAFVGTTLLDSKRKAILARRLLDQVGFSQVPVVQGLGGKAEKYLRIPSSLASLEFTAEGTGVLSDEDMNPKSSRLLQLGAGDLGVVMEMGEYLRANYKAGNRNNVEIVLLSSPEDLVEALTNGLGDAVDSIGTVHMLGGWTTDPSPTGKGIERRSTYNWNMAYIAARSLFFYMKNRAIPIDVKLYSSHMIKATFGGGSINPINFPNLIDALNKSSETSASLWDFKTASLAWDKHLVSKAPALANVIAPHIGNQFTPAGVLVMIGATNPKFVKSKTRVELDINLEDLDDSKGFLIELKESKRSRIELVERIDVKMFEKEVLASFKKAGALCSEALSSKPQESNE